MGKNPAFQFYPNDWLSDPQLQMTNIGTKGIWIQLICYMWWSPVRGQVQGTFEDLCKLARCKEADLAFFLQENEQYHFADVTESNKIVTIINRRMMREQMARESTRSRVQRFRNKECNASVTVPSPSTPSPSTPSPTPKTKNKRQILLANPDGFAAFWSRYPKKLGKDKAEKAWNVLNPQNGLVELILSSIDAHCRTQQWQDLQYIPYPATFLNGKRWEDDLVTPSQPIKPKPDKRLLWKSPDQYRDALKAGRIHPSERIPEWETTPYFVASVAEH